MANVCFFHKSVAFIHKRYIRNLYIYVNNRILYMPDTCKYILHRHQNARFKIKFHLKYHKFLLPDTLLDQDIQRIKTTSNICEYSIFDHRTFSIAMNNHH